MKITVSVSIVILLIFGILVSMSDLIRYKKNVAHLREVGSIKRHLQDTGEHDISPVIAVLIHEQTNLINLCESIKTLVNIQGSVDAPILAFHLQSTPELADQNHLQSCTDRSVFFAIVNLNSFPPGFEPVIGKDYTLAQINRFWTSGIWNHPALNPFDVIMKIDDTVCFSLPDETLPYFKKSSHHYKSHIFPGTVNHNIVPLRGMHDFALEYMHTENMIPHHSELWQRIHYTFHSMKTLPKFQDSFEVVNKHFMLQEDVSKWLNALTDKPPYGYYTQEWNVNAERVLTMSMFGSVSSIDTTLVTGFLEKDPRRGKDNAKICGDNFNE